MWGGKLVYGQNCYSRCIIYINWYCQSLLIFVECRIFFFLCVYFLTNNFLTVSVTLLSIFLFWLIFCSIFCVKIVLSKRDKHRFCKFYQNHTFFIIKFFLEKVRTLCFSFFCNESVERNCEFKLSGWSLMFFFFGCWCLYKYCFASGFNIWRRCFFCKSDIIKNFIVLFM